MPDPQNRWTNLGHWLATLPTYFPQQPDAVVVVTAHWEAAEFTVASGQSPELIYDYYGFPESTYDVNYPAPGHPAVASRLCELAAEHGVTLEADDTYGLDHGVFVPMSVSFPEADVPLVAVSLRIGLDPAEHIQFGNALSQIRDENVAVVGSGMSIHDLSFTVSAEETASFDRWLQETMLLPTGERDARLNRWGSAPGGRASHPREEHLLPLMVVAGTARSDDKIRRIFDDAASGWPLASYEVVAFNAP